MATDFLIMDDKLFFGNNYNFYVDLDNGGLYKLGGVTEKMTFAHAKDNCMYYYIYSKRTKSGGKYTNYYDLYSVNVRVNMATKIGEDLLEHSDSRFRENGDCYYISNYKLCREREGNAVALYGGDMYVSNIWGFSNEYVYFSGFKGNYGYLLRMNMNTDVTEIVDSHFSAGGGDAYFNW